MARPPSRLDKMREAHDKANADRRRLLERMKESNAAADKVRETRIQEEEARRSRFRVIDTASAIAAVGKLRFIDLEGDDARLPVALNRPTITLLEMFLRGLVERTSVAVLQWPRGVRDLSILHPIAKLAALTSPSPKITDGYSWCLPIPDFRTLYFPWRGSGTGTVQRRVLVERTELLKRNQLHLTRKQLGKEDLTPQLNKLHITLAHLCKLKSRSRKKLSLWNRL